MSSADGFLTALRRSDGTVLWRFRTSAADADKTEVVSSPPKVNASTVFVSFGDNLYAIDSSSGKETWRTSVSKNRTSAPAFADGRLLYWSDDRLTAFDPSTGRPQWKSASDGRAVVAQGNAVYLLNEDMTVQRVNCSNGEVTWTAQLGKGKYAMSIAAPDGKMIYALLLSAGHDGEVVGISAGNGSLEWRYSRLGRQAHSLCTDEKGTVYAIADSKPGMGDQLVAINTHNGQRSWSCGLGPMVTTWSRQVSIGPDGFLYVAGNGHLFAIK